MSQASNPDPLKSLFKAISEIIGYPAMVVSYLLALSGRLPGQYPRTTSIILVIITTVIVGGWRWRAIRQRRGSATGSLLSIPSGVSIPKLSPVNDFFDPLNRFSRRNYVYSLNRRRAESGLLLGLVLVSAGWTGTRFRSAMREFANPLLSCSKAREESLRVIIANIQDSGGKPGLLVEDRLYDFLSGYGDGQFEVCRWKEAIPVRTRAKEVAENNRADMLIWGRRDVIYEIFLEVPAWESLNRTLSQASSEEAASPSFQFTEDKHLGYVIEFAVSEMLFLDGEAEEAQRRLTLALNQATQLDFAENYKNDFAEGYFLLGLFYDPNTESDHPDPQKAIEAYSKALAWLENFFPAALNRGVIRASEGHIEDAIADFSLLIEGGTPLKGSAYVNRAYLLMLSDPQAAERDFDQALQYTEGVNKAEVYFFRGTIRMGNEDYSGAVEDLEHAVALNPQEYFFFHYLGLAQLFAGQPDGARQTYEQIVPTLDEATCQQVMNDLSALAEERTDLKPVIDEIIAKMKAAKLPKTSP